MSKTHATLRKAVAGAGIMAVLAVVAAPSAWAQEASEDVHTTSVPAAVAAAAVAEGIRLDGILDEPAWAAATPASGFVQREPVEGAAATQRTEVRFLVAADALYVGARMYDDGGRDGVIARLVRRDGNADADRLRITLDTFHDHQGQTVFSINPAGVRGDAYGPAGAFTDDSWDPVWEAETTIDGEGWTAELRIPLSQLRFSPGVNQEWGLQIERTVKRLNEESVWAFWGLTESGGPQRFGHLRGLDIESSPARGELTPYLVGVSNHLPEGAVATRDTWGYRVGGDFKAYPTPSLTLSGTFNPDFGQVEVDPAVVNLSAFETFFQEKRPFFIEGRGRFRFGSLSCFFCSNVSSLGLFFSRRIGRVPQGLSLVEAPQGARIDAPDNTTILGAAKLAGQTRSGWSIGVMNAVTSREMATVTPPTGSRFEREVEPFTNYFVARAARDFRGGQSQVALFGTSVLRDLSDPGLASLLNDHAESFGVAQQHYWQDRTYSFGSQIAYTQIAGSPEAILRSQLSSARYFQRPDRETGANGFLTSRYDPELTVMRGIGAYARISKDAGEWLWEAATNFRSPGFENNDIAFLTRADYVWMNANVLRQFQTPTSWYRNLNFTVGAQQEYSFDGILNGRQARLAAGITLPNYWNFFSFWIHRFERFNERLARGGPVLKEPDNEFFLLNVSSDSRKALVADLNLSGGCDGEDACDITVGTGLRYRPVPNLSLSFSPSWSRNESTYQYVTRIEDPTATSFFGNRYVFADLEQTTVTMDTRVNWTFTPDLTLEVFAQPFVATGRYSRFKEFARPRDAEKRVYGEDVGSVSTSTDGFLIDPDGPGPASEFELPRQDFNFRSLRGNAVLRWEFSPGSTVFLVWTQNRADTGAEGDFDFGRDFRALRTAPAENIFLLKLVYWLGF